MTTIVRDDVQCRCVGGLGPNPECGACGGSGCITAEVPTPDGVIKERGEDERLQDLTRARDIAEHQRNCLFEFIHGAGVRLGVIDPKIACGVPQLMAAMDAYFDHLAAASTVQSPSSRDSGVGETEGWRSMDSAPKDGTEVLLWTRDGLYAAAWLKDGQAGSCQEDWHTYDGYKWYVICSNPPTAWMPQPSAPRPSQREG